MSLVKTASGIRIIASNFSYSSEQITFKALPTVVSESSQKPVDDSSILGKVQSDSIKGTTTSKTVVPAAKSTTILCTKGKVTRKIVGINPKCPNGFKKK
jgi:hypothetical protein